jgi:hypothetical protein
VRRPSRRSTVAATMPSLAEVQQEPTILTGLPLPVIADMLRAIGQLLVARRPRRDACHKERTRTVLGWAS